MDRTQKTFPRTAPTCRYDARRKVLYVCGQSFRDDLEHVWELVQTDQVPFLIDTIVHTVEGVGVPMFVTGHFLSAWMLDCTCPDWLWHFETQARRSA